MLNPVVYKLTAGIKEIS